jgi:sterol desaturase/sphingolipid hydroxylase (fatty acid hydroxylase superfamily)
VTTDLFYVGLGYTVLRLVDGFIGSDVMVSAIQGALHLDNFKWFIGLPILLQAFIISFIFDFGQYWMHRGMHNWYPLWLPHSVHHYITQLNINKGAVGNPVELFLIGLGIGGFFDFVPRVPAGRRDRPGRGQLSAYQRAVQFAALVALPVPHHRTSQPAPFAGL